MLVSISDFAKEHNVETQAVYKFIVRHEEYKKYLHEDGKKKTFDRDGELYRILEEQYPIPKPTIVVNGVPEEEHRQALERLADCQENLVNAQKMMLQMQKELADQKLLLSEKEQTMKFLEVTENQLKETNEKLEEQIKELSEALDQERSKTWWQRLRGK